MLNREKIVWSDMGQSSNNSGNSRPMTHWVEWKCMLRCDQSQGVSVKHNSEIPFEPEEEACRQVCLITKHLKHQLCVDSRYQSASYLVIRLTRYNFNVKLEIYWPSITEQETWTGYSHCVLQIMLKKSNYLLGNNLLSVPVETSTLWPGQLINGMDNPAHVPPHTTAPKKTELEGQVIVSHQFIVSFTLECTVYAPCSNKLDWPLRNTEKGISSNYIHLWYYWIYNLFPFYD